MATAIAGFMRGDRGPDTAGRRRLAVLIVCLAAVSTAPAGTTEVKRIIVGYDADGQITATYELVDEAHEIRFQLDSDLRKDYWSVADPSFAMLADRLTSLQAFDEVTVRLVPNDRPVDRVYPSLVELDDTSAVVNLDYVAAAGASQPSSIEIRNAYDPLRKRCTGSHRIGAKGSQLPDTNGRYVLLSASLAACRHYASQAETGIIYSPDVSPALVELFSASVLPGYASLKSRFAVDLSPEPLVILARNVGACRDQYQGDVGWDSIISVRFHGTAWDTLDDGSADQLVISMMHELVHLWIGKYLRTETGDGPRRAWLHEGAAEYIALLEVLESGRLPREQVLARIQRRVSACLYDLDGRYLLTDEEPAGGPLVYDCGTLVQLVYDAVSRAESQARQTIVDLWRKFLLAANADAGPTVRPDAFVASHPAAREMLSSVLYGPEVDLASLASALGRYGIDAELGESTSVGRLANGILMPFFRADCEGGPVGFWTNSDHLVLDAPENCKTIPGGFVLRYVEGQDLVEAPSAAYRAAAAACEEAGVVRLAGMTAEEPQLSLRCPGSLPTQPIELRIVDISFL